ncbi:MAG: hypothetical protein KGJ57_02770 [Sphingomonadales bacterium]|nr:hypothetical protein [Sphingomonadales bacterium]MDE2168334.1 hypothetical protein [Sphingomonadales bacterium]
MIMTRDRLHTIGWGMALTICFALMMALTVRVNAVKSEVRLADRQINELSRQKMLLDTEFQTRASQQQLTAFNDVDFGLEAPKPAQYLENERQLAVLGKAPSPDAPPQIRVASADLGTPLRPGLVSAVTPVAGRFIGSAVAAEVPRGDVRRPLKASQLEDRLSQVAPMGGGHEE